MNKIVRVCNKKRKGSSNRGWENRRGDVNNSKGEGYKNKDNNK
jgi:hypothetical protein